MVVIVDVVDLILIITKKYLLKTINFLATVKIKATISTISTELRGNNEHY